jgi:hypothetical protein
MKKYFMAAVAFICISLVSIVMTSCSSEETTTIKTETVYYKYDTAKLYYVKGQEAKLAAFITEMGDVLSSVSSADVTESNLIQRIQAIVDIYNNKYLHGTFELMKSTDGSNFNSIKTFTMTAAPEYL